MAESTSWPNYLPLPREDIFAIGVIALSYGRLENMLQAMFAAVIHLNQFQTQALFHRMGNRPRLDALIDLLGKTTIPQEVKDLTIYFLDGFEVCADNRHFVMHSSSGGLHVNRSDGTRGLILERYSRTGNKLECYVTLPQLKTIADEMHAFTIFGASLVTDITNYATLLSHGQAQDFQPLPSTSREKPPRPTTLNWRSPDPATPGIPPAALPLISPYRVREHGSEDDR